MQIKWEEHYPGSAHSSLFKASYQELDSKIVRSKQDVTNHNEELPNNSGFGCLWFSLGLG